MSPGDFCDLLIKPFDIRETRLSGLLTIVRKVGLLWLMAEEIQLK